MKNKTKQVSAKNINSSTKYPFLKYKIFFPKKRKNHYGSQGKTPGLNRCNGKKGFSLLTGSSKFFILFIKEAYSIKPFFRESL
jgi:hypothetical protein